MAEVVPLTKLDAINQMLHDLGERPVNSLAGSTRLDVNRAIASLDSVLRRLLNRGWWFNSESIRLTVDGAGLSRGKPRQIQSAYDEAAKFIIKHVRSS